MNDRMRLKKITENWHKIIILIKTIDTGASELWRRTEKNEQTNEKRKERARKFAYALEFSGANCLKPELQVILKRKCVTVRKLSCKKRREYSFGSFTWSNEGRKHLCFYRL